jgi:polysaccharide export outer membrane protein
MANSLRNMSIVNTILVCLALPLTALFCFGQSVGPDHASDTEASREFEAVMKSSAIAPLIHRTDDSSRFGFQERRYELQPGDIFELKFPFVAEFNQTVTIQPDGFITLDPIGDLKAAGNTVPKLAALLNERYRSILKNPEIRLNLIEFRRPYFTASGEVGKPGKYELSNHTTVAEAIAIAGGFTEAAKHSQVLLFRSYSEEWVEVKTLNIKDLMRSGDLSEDIQLRSGDMIYVPKNALSKIKSFMPRMSLIPSIRPR